jgi:hypothetical protein
MPHADTVRPIDHRELYRLPWTLSDNVIAWLEPTAKCNLACDGCYRENVNTHKTLAQVREELDVFSRVRRFDGVSIAGGDPLLHPQIVDIVRMVAERGHKPILNTNGLALTDELLQRLKGAGVAGFTFHVDSKQGRPGWKGKSEIELNELRLSFARRVAEAGDLVCSFNSTVYEDTLEQVPDLVEFAQDHIDVIHVMVFITLRAALLDGDFDYYHDGKKIDAEPLQYSVEAPRRRLDVSTREVARTIQDRFPDFAPSAYLGGTEKADSLKWLITGRLGIPGKIFGYAGPKFMEAGQLTHHAVKGTYMGYLSPGMAQWGKAMLTLGALDPGTRTTAANYASHLATHPRDLLKPLHYQSIAIIQPIDILPDGRQNMCDGCPDMTVHQGQLVWSCRLDECLRFGGFVQTVPLQHANAETVVPLRVSAPIS